MMTLPRARFRRILSVLSIALLGGCTNVRQREDFPHRYPSLQRVAVMPPRVTMGQISLTGPGDPHPDDVERICGLLPGILSAALQRHGVIPIVGALPHDASRSAHAQVQTAFEAFISEVYRRSWSKTLRYPAEVGPEAVVLAKAMGVDALLVSHYSGSRLSDGLVFARTLAELLVFFSPVKDSRYRDLLEVALVDGRSGEILWANRLEGETASAVIPPYVLVDRTLSPLMTRESDAGPERRIPIADSASISCLQ